MKTLTKVKLINWYTFVNQEFQVYKNTLITGENGSGKSTVLDAVQYVLTIGTCKFNKAASDIGDRTLETYMRCKTGEEGNEYKRTGDVTSYIVLEFYDEKTKAYQILGVVADLASGGKPWREFFQIVDKSINQVSFIINKKILTKREFKNNLNNNSQQAIFKDTIRDSKRLFSNALGVKEKYFDLVTKALAFKAIDKVYQFIMDFLLKEDFVDIDNLRQSIQHYRRIEEQLKLSQKECETLEPIIEKSKIHGEITNKIEIQNFVKEKIKEKNFVHLISLLEEKEKKLTSKLEQVNANLIQLQQDNELDMNQLNEVNNSMFKNESYRLKEKIQQSFDEVKREKEKKVNAYEILVNEIRGEAAQLKQLRIHQKFVEYVASGNFTSNELQSYILEIIESISIKKEKLEDQVRELINKSEKDTSYFSEKMKEYEALKQNQLIYKPEVHALIELLKEKLFNHYGKHIEVKPLCEYLEVKDETWRNAIEGYLNTQRFDIIVDPEYFGYAMRAYEEYKSKHGIFGVGIVDVAKLKRFNDIDIKGTLAEKVDSKNIYARWYTNMLLRYVMCVDDIGQLRQYRTAITKTVMLYKNYTVRALNPHIYKNPVIGLGAIKIQKKEIEMELEELKPIIEADKKRKQQLSINLNQLKALRSEKLSYRLQLIDEYQSIVSNYNIQEKRLNKITLDDTILSLQEESGKLSERIEVTKQKIYEFHTQKVTIEVELNQLGKDFDNNKRELKIIRERILQYELEHIDATERADRLIMNYEKRFSRNFKKISEEIERKQSEWIYQLNTIATNIAVDMTNYNNVFNVGYENTIEAIQEYIKKYRYLKDIEIVDKIDKARQAKLKSEETFQTSFVSGLNEKIDNAKRDILFLNKNLSKRDFNGETYEFCISPTSKTGFKEYYEIIHTGKDYISDNLLSETLDESQRKIMDELFERLSSTENNADTEKLLTKYTDYRNYLDYDIKITKSNGAFSYFSKTNRGKSGGETQTPFYVIMAASFEQIIKDRNSVENFGCVVLFDEAFNNMDEPRIKEMIKFYNERDIQTFIAVPPSRASTIIPYVNTSLLVIKHEEQSFIEVITDESV
ncbi:uncharacterized protein YPO0396 [Breznakia sp. PF5-3]|uniref:ATP-binding protein n=1 Tax=unclassified Breznakia TaxID=2623764 RepID=UPI0024061859|nr:MULTISPECIES: SbcC/MukB-like Walker B domain-containing protein [unclassified Breznakia]MDL2276823.1 hypothetical protein [Breznakia sp. OttesenSCG-928-G09]MDF9825514.1 uncharacterized protein YPO0396 [Breznakia sp. PM6-1]MDF9836381.1 uncharacterized protein YPO0396 [Breznakia sp. PF5-3]MDF9838725.1 uncharacterized protein YPO0396 [Breznakia sp. PFB2-8]MDF9860533.1 uncharacterized protein YPO0396 [Breznakia sp. PH5-24]